MQALFCASFLFALFSASLLVSTAERGVSILNPMFSVIRQETWTCLRNRGFTFAIVEAANFNFGGRKINTHASYSIKNAKAVGISSVDVAIFPCSNCGNATWQVQTALNNIKTNNVLVGRVWVSVNQMKWSSSATVNVDFIRQVIDEVKAQNYSVGIYTDSTDWNPITNNSAAFKDYGPLWYEGNQDLNFNDFQSFGGWTTPTMKQYVYHQESDGQSDPCNVDFGENYRV